MTDKEKKESLDLAWQEVGSLRASVDKMNGDIGSLQDEINTLLKDVESAKEAQEKAEKEAMEAVEILENLVNHYIANRGTDHEFVRCITPDSASRMSPLGRISSKTWSLWDRARIFLGETK